MNFCAWCRRRLPLLIVLAVLILDQGSKFLIKLNMRIGEEIRVFSWFRIHFLENNGMAFGLSFGEFWGKLALSLLRLAAIGFLIWYIRKLNRKMSGAGTLADANAGADAGTAGGTASTKSGIALKPSLLISLSLILAGAIGNMLDSAFYGLIFSESYYHVAEIFPEGGGYAPFLFGRVVDMLYFPLIQGHFPSWFPVWGGNEFLFFRPVFNVADSAVTVGFILFLITQRSFWWPSKK